MSDTVFPSHKKLYSELRRLKALWKAVDLSFQVARKQFGQAVRDRRVDPASPVVLPSEPETEVAGNHYILLNKLQSQYPRYVRETLFVRLITTLEVFLVDLARDLFMHRTDLLQTNKVIEMTHAEALAMESTGALREKILAKELRQLHSAGVLEIAKFYERYFRIKFPDCLQGITLLWEIHDRRHLLVHRLGRADREYRHKYKYTGKSSLSVDATYLNGAFNAIEAFTDTLVKKAASLASQQTHTSSSSGFQRYEVELEVVSASEAADRTLNRNFHFVINDRATGDRSVCLRDILTFSRDGDQGRVLLLSGNREEIRGFIRELRKLEKKGMLSILRTTVHGRPTRTFKESPEPSLPPSTVEGIARRLPKRPWPKHVHKAIAKAMGISNSQCSRAITKILEDERLLSLVGAQEEANQALQQRQSDPALPDHLGKPSPHEAGREH